MINYNLVLYVGIAFYALIFVLFIANEMNKRKKDIEQWKLNQSFNKAKEMEKSANR